MHISPVLPFFAEFWTVGRYFSTTLVVLFLHILQAQHASVVELGMA
jgi:hypothetical protein